MLMWKYDICIKKKTVQSRWREAEEDVNVLERKSIFFGNAYKILWIEQQALRLHYDFQTARKMITLNSNRVRLHFRLEDLRWKAHMPFGNLCEHFTDEISSNTICTQKILPSTQQTTNLFSLNELSRIAPKILRFGFTSAKRTYVEFSHHLFHTRPNLRRAFAFPQLETTASSTFQLQFRQTANVCFTFGILVCCFALRAFTHCIRSQTGIENK